jgi:hypothetical protein
MDATMTLTGDLKQMSGDDGKVHMTNKEESPSRIVQDGHDRQSLRAALQSRIDPIDPLSKQVITFAEKKKRLSVGEHALVDQEAIYTRVIGLLVSQRDLDLQQVIATELTAYPSSMFNADGQMRVATGKSTLNNHIQEPTTIIMDVSAVLWTVEWSAHGTVDTFISGFKVWLSV